jgi:hypothetical protein
MRIAGIVALATLLSAPASGQEGISHLLTEERPIEVLNTVWIEEMTWMEIRDALAAGTTTVIIPTGGIEQNGPYVAMGKHNYILRVHCDAIARQLGNALCAPIIKLVPEGTIEGTAGHMRYTGTISLRPWTFQAVLDDVASSLKTHGFTDIVFIGDSGGNQDGMEAVASQLNRRWTDARAHFIGEYYDNEASIAFLEREYGIREVEGEWHDNYWITTLLMVYDPVVVRYEQRVSAGLAHINGVDIAPREETIAIGEALTKFRVDAAVRAIEASIATPDDRGGEP